MNDKEYFEKSITSKCRTLRCPISNYCSRRAYTIYFYSEFAEINHFTSILPPLIREGIVPEDFEKKSIPVQSEAPIWNKSQNLLYYRHMCPEVNLFEHEHALPFAIYTASSDGEWDNFREVKKFKNLQYKHFSECAEYNHYIFEKKRLNTNTRKRSNISRALRFEIYQRDNFTCQYCGCSKDDGIKLSLDHKIPYSDGGKDTFENLVTACMNCNIGKGNKII